MSKRYSTIFIKQESCERLYNEQESLLSSSAFRGFEHANFDKFFLIHGSGSCRCMEAYNDQGNVVIDHRP